MDRAAAGPADVAEGKLGVAQPSTGSTARTADSAPTAVPRRRRPRTSETDSPAVRPILTLVSDRPPALERHPAVFVPGDPPRTGQIAFYGPGLGPATADGERLTVVLAHGNGVRRSLVPAVRIPLAEAVPILARAARAETADPAAAFWGAAALFAVHLVARGRLLPGVSSAGFDAWRAGPLELEDTDVLHTLATAMPPSARAVPLQDVSPLTLPAAEPLLRAFLDAVADTMPRTAGAAIIAAGPYYAAWDRQPAEALRPWATGAAAGLDAGVGVSLRIELDDEAFRAVVQVHSLSDPTVITDALALWRGRPGRAFNARAQVETLLTLRRAARAWPVIDRLLAAPVPDAIELTDEEVLDLFGTAAVKLAAAGVRVHLPKQLVRGHSARAVLATRKPPGSRIPGPFGLDALVDFRWQLAIGDQELTEQEMDRLAEATRPLIRLRDQWVLVDEDLLRKARRHQMPPLTAIDALAAALTGHAEIDGELVEARATGWLAQLREHLAAPQTAAAPIGAPAELNAVLRTYQLDAVRWLEKMTSLQLGACLADDMGLGKTITLIALHLQRQQNPATAAPTLVVCPTSLLGNWQREIERFAPSTPVRRYHGPARHLNELAPGEIVLTTYGTVRQDAEALAELGWGLVAADEAQHVKNPYSHTAQALRRIDSAARVALTGTPVENRLSELWALLDWTTPGLLGTLKTFRTRYAKPIEEKRDPAATERLARLIGPFVLRRRKTDPGIAPELPPKTETDHPVALTREQAVLYESFARETMAQITAAAGIERRGLVLKLLTGLKQICNHPAQFIKDDRPEPDEAGRPARSGKLELLDELLDTLLAEQASSLVFTQFVQMGRLLQDHLARRAIPAAFLHGQTSVRRRQEMIDAFQAGQVPVFLLSLKAAGVGLNLTRASHVFHYDRWWNPAVEDQATDRAYRIGQTQPVQVHRLITEGTVEDRIATTLAAKRELADRVLAAGEAAFTELSNAELAELVTLRAADR